MNRRGFLAAAAGAAASTVAADAGDGSPAKPKVRIGQIGTAHGHAAGKVAALGALADEFEFVGVAEPDPARRAALAGRPEYRGVAWMTEEQLLGTPGLQAVAVETAVEELVPAARRAIAAGLHVHIDKPAGTSLTAFAALLKEAEAKVRCVQMGYMFRTNPGFRFCFEAARSGLLGKVLEVHGVIGKKLDDEDRREQARLPGGGMFELGCHLIDAAVAVLGSPEKVTAYARRTRDDGLADNQLAVLEYTGAVATVRAHLAEPHGGGRRQFAVVGTQGTAEIRPLEPPTLLLALERSRDGYRAGYQEVSLPKPGGRYDDQLREFAAVVRGERGPGRSREHDLAVHEAVLRASGMPLD